MPSGRTINFPESGRGLGHVTPTIFGSTVGYPSDSLASCLLDKFHPEILTDPPLSAAGSWAFLLAFISTSRGPYASAVLRDIFTNVVDRY